MTTIDSAPRLAAILRQQVAAFRPAAAKKGLSGAGGAARQAGDVAAVVAQRIHALAPDDPARKQKAVRIFLESVLLQELGSGLVQDAGFADMVDAVLRQMADDAGLALAVDQLGDMLIAR